MNEADFPLELVANGGSPFLRTAKKSPICLFIGQKTDYINLFSEAPNMLTIIEELVRMYEETPILCHFPSDILQEMKEALKDVKGNGGDFGKEVCGGKKSRRT